MTDSSVCDTARMSLDAAGGAAVIGRPVYESCSHMRRRCVQHVMHAGF